MVVFAYANFLYGVFYNWFFVTNMNVFTFCSFMKFVAQTDRIKNWNKKLASETK